MCNKRHHSQISSHRMTHRNAWNNFNKIHCTTLTFSLHLSIALFSGYRPTELVKFHLTRAWKCGVVLCAATKGIFCASLALIQNDSKLREVKQVNELVARCETLRLTMANRQLADSIVRNKSHPLYVPIYNYLTNDI